MLKWWVRADKAGQTASANMLRHKDDSQFYFCFAGFTPHSTFNSRQQVLKHWFRYASDQLSVITWWFRRQREGWGFLAFHSLSCVCPPRRTGLKLWLEILLRSNPIFYLYGLKLSLKCQYHFKSRAINWIYAATCVLLSAIRRKMHLWYHFICSWFKRAHYGEGAECRD